MVECNSLKVIKLIKISIHLSLFLAFIILSALALRDLLSDKTTFNSWQEYRDITPLPSFTICLSNSNTSVFDKYSLAWNNSKNFGSKWVSIDLKLKLTNGTFWASYDNDINIEQYYLTEKYCKPYFLNPKLCVPCLSINSLTTFDKLDSAEVY